MFNDYIIREDSLENVLENGEITGFKFAVKIADYRGCFLSLVNGYFVECDGIEYPADKQKLAINGKEPRTYEEIKKCVWEHWDYDDEAYIYVEKKSGLAPGVHCIRLQQSILMQYGYMPWDEEWVKNTPVPGSGAGAGKSNIISEFKLELKNPEVM
ncbi:MAG: DUF6379 domain-containing protein [Eubacteriales bacterium]